MFVPHRKITKFAVLYRFTFVFFCQVLSSIKYRNESLRLRDLTLSLYVKAKADFETSLLGSGSGIAVQSSQLLILSSPVEAMADFELSYI